MARTRWNVTFLFLSSAPRRSENRHLSSFRASLLQIIVTLTICIGFNLIFICSGTDIECNSFLQPRRGAAKQSSRVTREPLGNLANNVSRNGVNCFVYISFVLLQFVNWENGALLPDTLQWVAGCESDMRQTLNCYLGFILFSTWEMSDSDVRLCYRPSEMRSPFLSGHIFYVCGYVFIKG